MERSTVPDVVAQFPVWKCGGFGLVVSSGLLLASEQALKLHRCPLFRARVGLMVLVICMR